MNDTPDLDALGSQYREAKASIGIHRQRQAAAEDAYAEALSRSLMDRTAPEVVAAKVEVDQAVADVRWCQAVTVAAGEAYKGVSFEDVVARNDETRAGSGSGAIRDRALRAMEGST